MRGLDRTTCQNAITHLPYAHLRTMAMGWGRAVPDDVQMGEIVAGVERGMSEGAVGLSTGLDYIAECFSTTDELVEACAAMAPQQGLYVTHVRYKKRNARSGQGSGRNRTACRRAGIFLTLKDYAAADRRVIELCRQRRRKRS